ncbi:hypothetical protein Tco_0924131 [Tanacetum coccineum]|uniref:Retrovirus-related Pol polyprotein from transposon TNT 1-94-like beta-barrel domain-containing protein n=1 Tax=Tanacetum coccineum TaxID=301880 RepID=A0ABQ5D4G6_9ASTR
MACSPVSTARLVSTARPVSTVRPFAPKIAQTSGAIRPIYPRMDNVRPRGSYSLIKRSYYTKPAFRPKDLKQDVKTSRVQNMTIAGTRAVVNNGKGKMDTDLKKSRWVWRPKGNYLDHVSKESGSFMLKKGNLEILLQDHAVVDSGCSSHMTGNKAYLSDYEDYNGGFVAFGSDPKGGKIMGKVHKDPAFDDFDDAMDYMETGDAHDEGIVKDSEETRVSTEDQVSTDKLKVSTDKPNEGTAEPKDGNSDESAAPTTVFRDDETIAQFLVTMSQNKTKQKGFEIKDTDRPRTTTERSILTLKPPPKIDPKDKGKKVLKEKAELDAESEARKVQEEWEAKEEKKKLVEEEATKAAFTNEYDLFKQDLMQTKFLLRSFKKKREKSSPLSKEPSGYRHAQLNKKKFEEIQVMYEKKRESSLVSIIRVSEEPESTKVKAKIEEPKENIRKRSGRRLKMKAPKRMDLVERHSPSNEKRFETTPPKGIDLLLWGDLRIMFESKEDDELWKNQEEWKLQSWIFYENCGVHVLRLEDGTEINMLAERRYPLTKNTLERMMDLRLTAVSDDDTVFDLLRFIEQQIDEFGGQDGSEKDL